MKISKLKKILKSTIVKNCKISEGVTILQKNKYKNEKYSIIGDNCYIETALEIISVNSSYQYVIHRIEV